MPRRNHKARAVVRGEARKGRHKLDYVEVVEVVAQPDPAGAVPGKPGPQPRPEFSPERAA